MATIIQGNPYMRGLAVCLLTCGLAVPASAQEATYYLGLGHVNSDGEGRVIPVLTVEAGQFSFGLDETTYAVIDHDSYALDFGLAYDVDGGLDGLVRGAIYGAGDLSLGYEIVHSFQDDGAEASLDLAYDLSFGYVQITPSIGVQWADTDRNAADHDVTGVGDTVTPYVGVTALIPLSRATAIIADITLNAYDDALVAANAVDDDMGIDTFVAIVREF